MKLLFIGGTRFVGRHLVQAALQAGHEITLFHRGQTNQGLFPQTEEILGDRDHDLDLLKGRSWEAVIDTCGYFPRQVRASAEALAGRIQHYVFISSISVYADFQRQGLDESAPLATTDDPDAEEMTGENYGPLKALCESTLVDAFGDGVFIPRPGLIVGPYDPTDRFTYWVRRCSSGKLFLAPGPGHQQVQLIDARDLAAWILHGLKLELSGSYNATGPAEALNYRAMLHSCLEGGGVQAEMVWMTPEFLKEHEVEPWSDLPLWLPDEDSQGMLAANCSKAIRDGLVFRPLRQTVADTVAWDRERGLPPLKAGLSLEREAELINAWTSKTE